MHCQIWSLFLFVDFRQKVVRGTEDDGGKVTSAIANSEKTESQIILQGVENHRGWSAAIDRTNGRLALSSSGADLSFLIMGACTAP